MKVRKILISLGIVTTLLVIYGIYKLSTFKLFSNESKIIEEFRVPERNYQIRIYYIPSNATTQSYIQIRKFENGVEEVLESYERFNYLINYEILNHDTLKLSISDTSRVKLTEIKKLNLPKK